MEPNTTSSNRRILLAIGFVLFFVVIVLVWYFFYYKPITTTDPTAPRDPLVRQILPPRFQFINWNNEPDTSTSTTEVIDPLKDPLIQIWNKPATGGTFITDQILKEIKETVGEGTTTVEIKKTVRATSTIALFVDRATGYIYGYSVDTGTVFQISNSIIPGVYDAYFFDNGRRIIMRYVDQTKNTVVGLIATVPLINQGTDASPLENIKYLTSQVQSLAVNESKTEVSYVVATDGGSAIYSVTGTKNPTLLTSSPFREWSIVYGGNTLYATTKPSAYVEGTTFSLPRFEAELSEKTGLMSLPSSSGTFLSSMWGKQGLATFLSLKGDIRLLPFTTLAPKCAQREESTFICAIPRDLPKSTEGLPDDWFQGRIAFNDDLFLVDAITGDKFSLYSFTDKDGLFDVTHIKVSDTGEYFTFINKQDATLWLLNTDLIEGE
jgi:hypothetical protein